MNETILTLSRAIKMKKWIQLIYRNLQNEVTKYWIGIKEILDSKRFLVDSVKYGKKNLTIVLLACLFIGMLLIRITNPSVCMIKTSA
jgi:hypothetical protein